MERWTIYLVLTLVSLTILNRQMQSSEAFPSMKSVFEYVHSFGLFGKVVTTLSIAIATILCLSFGVAEIAVSALFPPYESVIMIFLGRISGALASFWLTTRFPAFRNKVRDWMVSLQYLRSMQILLREQPYKYLLLIRFSNMPAPLKNYGAAMLGVAARCFVISTLIEISIMSCMKVFIGKQVQTMVDSYQSQGNLGMDLPSYLVSALGIGSLVYLSYKVYSTVEAAGRQAAEEERTQQNAQSQAVKEKKE